MLLVLLLLLLVVWPLVRHLGFQGGRVGEAGEGRGGCRMRAVNIVEAGQGKLWGCF